MTKATALMLIVGAFTITGAALARKPEIVQISPDTYMIFKEDHKGIFGSLAKMKVAIIKQANEFAAKQGKVAIPISSKEKPLGNGPAQWASFEYQFRVVSKDDPEARRTALLPRPDVVVHSTQNVTAEVTLKEEKGKAAPEKPVDLYAELLKLDDLRKRGILTEEEFEAQKRILLNPPKVPETQADPPQ